MKKFISYFSLPFFAAASALNYKLFVFPNSFAPSGLDGVCTMIQYLLHTNMGYLALLANLPLLLAAWGILNREFTIKTGIYTLSFSLSVIALDYIDVSAFCYYTETGTSTVLAPVAAGVFRGILYAFTLKLGGSSGGVDILAAIIKKYKAHYNLMQVIFMLNICIACSSYFVYGMKIEPVICSVLYAFVTTSVSTRLQAAKRETVRFDIITEHAHALCEEISVTLCQSATVVNARGAHSGSNKKMVICVTDKRRVPLLEQVLARYPDTVAFESLVANAVYHK